MDRILVIEDNETVRKNILTILDFEGFSTLGAADGEAGLRLVQEHCPDLIICDIMMPGMDGLAVLRAVRFDPDTCEIPFVFLTARAARSEIRHGMEQGADDYLTKPFTRDELLAVIRTRIARRAWTQSRYQDLLCEEQQKAIIAVNYDESSGLPNRAMLRECAEYDIARLRPGQSLWVAAVVLNHLNNIHSAVGLDGTDRLIRELVRRIMSFLPPGVGVARIDTNVFAVGPCVFSSVEDAKDCAASIVRAFQSPISLGVDGDIPISVSVGVSRYPEDAPDVRELLLAAELAAGAAGEAGGNRWVLFDQRLKQGMLDRVELAAGLRGALESDEFFLVYQPRIDIRSGNMRGVEALIRWNHPRFGEISPARFIPVAENSGIIVEIGSRVLHMACLQAAAWQRDLAAPLAVSVNISALQLEAGNLSTVVGLALAESGLPASLLELELTESLLVRDVENTVDELSRIREMGVHISIDDFGTGYSSLAYLKRFPINALKIDRAFVCEIEEGSADEQIAASIIILAHRLGLTVVAEGVETAVQLEFLRERGCEEAQGYFFSRPLSVEGIYEYAGKPDRVARA